MRYCDLLTNVLEAHGGLANWRRATKLTARLSLGGIRRQRLHHGNGIVCGWRLRPSIAIASSCCGSDNNGRNARIILFLQTTYPTRLTTTFM
jgi:hypothetical protein